MSEQSAAKLSEAMKAALAGGYGNRGNDGHYRLLSQTPRRTVEALQSRGMVEGMTLTAEGVTVGAKHSPAKDFAEVVDAPHSLFIDGKEGRKLAARKLTPERVQKNANNARFKRMDWEQLADGTIRIETRHYVPQVQPASEIAPEIIEEAREIAREEFAKVAAEPAAEDVPVSVRFARGEEVVAKASEFYAPGDAVTVLGKLAGEIVRHVVNVYYEVRLPGGETRNYPLSELAPVPVVAPVEGFAYRMFVGVLRDDAKDMGEVEAANVREAIKNGAQLGHPVESLAGGVIRVGYSFFEPVVMEYGPHRIANTGESIDGTTYGTFAFVCSLCEGRATLAQFGRGEVKCTEGAEAAWSVARAEGLLSDVTFKGAQRFAVAVANDDVTGGVPFVHDRSAAVAYVAAMLRDGATHAWYAGEMRLTCGGTVTSVKPAEAAQDGTQERPGAVAAPEVPTGAQRCVRAALAAFGCAGGPAVVVLSSSGKSLALCEGCAEGARDSMRGVGQSWTEAAVSAPVSVEEQREVSEVVEVVEEVQSCRSEEGITVGLVDALIGIVRVLAPRDMSPQNVQDALSDLFEDSDFATVRDAWHGTEEGDPQARGCEECGAAPGEACSPLFTCATESPTAVEPQWVSEAQRAGDVDVSRVPRAAREYMERAGLIAG